MKYFENILFCYQMLCFSMSNYLNAYKLFFLFILTVALWNVFSPQKFCVVCIYILMLSDEGIKHWFNLYFNSWKLNIYIFGK